MGSKNCDLGFWQKWYKGLWDLFVRSFGWLRYDWTVSDSLTFIIHPQKLHLICYTYFLDHTLPVVHGNPDKQSFVVESLVSETMKRKSYSKGWGSFLNPGTDSACLLSHLAYQSYNATWMPDFICCARDYKHWSIT